MRKDNVSRNSFFFSCSRYSWSAKCLYIKTQLEKVFPSLMEPICSSFFLFFLKKRQKPLQSSMKTFLKLSISIKAILQNMHKTQIQQLLSCSHRTKPTVRSLAEQRVFVGDTGDIEGVTVDCKCHPRVDIRWSSPYLSEPNQQNKQHFCLPSLPSPPPPNRLSRLWPRCSPILSGHLADTSHRETWAGRPANLGTRVTSAALITLRYLCRRLPHQHPSAQPLCDLFSKFTLTLSTRPPPPLLFPSLLFGLVKVHILEVVHA